MLRSADPVGPPHACEEGELEHKSGVGEQVEVAALSASDFDRFIFIVGAPRCGTTTLATLFKQSGCVSTPIVKEPHYFAQNDLRSLPDSDLRRRVEQEYLGRFFRRDPSRRIGLDASVTYLYKPEQLEPILRLWPESRFIVSFRDPLTMLPSLHRRLIYLGDETIRSFAEAWAAIPARRSGRQIPARCADARWLLYDEAARFSTYLERLYSTVGRDRCQVVLFDELAADPAGEYRRLMEFVGLEPESNVNFSARRASCGVRSLWLQRLLKRPPKPMREYLAGEKFCERFRDLDSKRERKLPGAILKLRKRILKWNRYFEPPEELPPSLEEEIRRTFRGEVRRLGKLVGRDLDHWLQPTAWNVRMKKGGSTRGDSRAAFASELR
jgi:hypothetical protein